jgi:hypothetical protein
LPFVVNAQLLLSLILLSLLNADELIKIAQFVSLSC